MKKEKKEHYKENDLVTWKINDNLIIKGTLGQRRKHIVGEFDAEFYHPNTQRFMGQFPIDYQPKKFHPISTAEAKSAPQNNTGDPFEFYLMLNGSWVEPTDESIHSPRALDHEDQVKIVMANNSFVKEDGYNSKKKFENIRMKDVDKNSEHELYGMKCFNFLNGLGKRCFGTSNNPHISGFSVSAITGSNLTVNYTENYYGGIGITYIVSQKNMSKLNEIDQAIWRLLDAWNVSLLKPI